MVKCTHKSCRLVAASCYPGPPILCATHKQEGMSRYVAESRAASQSAPFIHPAPQTSLQVAAIFSKCGASSSNIIETIEICDEEVYETETLSDESTETEEELGSEDSGGTNKSDNELRGFD